MNDDAKSPEERYQNCDELHRLSSRDDADLINDIMNQKSSDEDYDFKLVESMDEVDGDNMNSVRGVSCSNVCPLSISLCINFSRMAWNFAGLFWIQYLLISPWISPLKQLFGCADRGGI